MNLAVLELRLGYHFQNKHLLIEALTHRSCMKPYNNERLEFLGDAVLDLLVGEYLFERFPKYDEGKLSKMRSSLVNEKSFALFGRGFGLGEMLRLSVSEEQNHGRQKDSLLSNAFEAVIGAIYREAGIECVRKIVYGVLSAHYPNMQIQDLTIDYKTALQEMTQELFGALPVYELLEQSGPDHQKEFVVQISICNAIYGSAQGSSKKSAQQACAKIAYEILTKKKSTIKTTHQSLKDPTKFAKKKPSYPKRSNHTKEKNI